MVKYLHIWPNIHSNIHKKHRPGLNINNFGGVLFGIFLFKIILILNLGMIRDKILIETKLCDIGSLYCFFTFSSPSCNAHSMKMYTHSHNKLKASPFWS